jgi:uncharacterized Zn-finger protein
MAAGAIPHFHNTMGAAKIEINAHEFMCIGALPPFDHPHVFLDMGASHEIICPYCSTHYVVNTSIPANSAKPAEAVWRKG